MSSPFHLQQEVAFRAHRIMVKKLEAQGFTFVHDAVTPPPGMGGFAASEKILKALDEALEEVKRPALSLVPTETR